MKNEKQPLVASLLLVVRLGAPSSFLFLVLVAMPGTPSSVLAPSLGVVFRNKNLLLSASRGLRQSINQAINLISELSAGTTEST